MKSNKMFGALVASAIAVSTPALGAGGKDKKAGGKKGAWCESLSCGGMIEGAKNSCAGQKACAGVNKEKCEKKGPDGKPAGKWHAKK